MASKQKSSPKSSSKSFDEKVWELTKRIPAGRVATYGDVARKLGTKAYRAVGSALHRNPYAPVVPCHRVVGSDGGLTGFAGGLPKKQKMLEAEGVRVVKGKVDLSTYRWKA
jgi:methylated-DNA-[protein]-cysteine S-methyltransferase